MIIEGKAFPDFTVLDDQGKSHALWDYRQKTHLVLVNDPGSSAQQRVQWSAEVAAQKKTWDWLNVKFLFAQPTDKLPAGAYLVERYGTLIKEYPAGGWSLEGIEREFTTFEAKHC